MKAAKTVPAIMGLLPEDMVQKIGQACGVDSNVSHLFGLNMLRLLIYACLRGGKLSTRVLEQYYNSLLFSVMSGKGGHQTRHSSLAERLSKMPPTYLRSIFEQLSSLAQAQLPRRNKWLNKIVRFDSTMRAISSALVKRGMFVGRKPKKGYKKVQIKVTIGMRGLVPESADSYTEQKYLSEETALYRSIQQASLKDDDIVVFDRGLKGRKTLAALDKDHRVLFVTRASKNLRYKLIELHTEVKGRVQDGLEFLQDSVVYLYRDGHNIFEHKFRLVEVMDLKKGKRMIFLTNIWDDDAALIAQYYLRRWDIEVFFRFLKQELNFNHLLSHNEQGIENQLYATMIAALLLLIYKHNNQLQGYHLVKLQFEEQLLVAIFKELIQRLPPEQILKLLDGDKVMFINLLS